MLDFYEAGGIPVLMKELQEALWDIQKDLHRHNGSKVIENAANSDAIENPVLEASRS